MPNHVYSRLTLEGSYEDIYRFKLENSVNGGFTFQKGVPMPQKKNLTAEEVKCKLEGEDIVIDDWYQWSVDNWGVKWDCWSELGKPYRQGNPIWGGNDDDDLEDHEILYSTAWGTAGPYFLNVSKKYPNLTFHTYYVDEGECFAGESHYKDGALIKEVALDMASEDREALIELEDLVWFERGSV